MRAETTLRRASQILDEHDPQRDGDRPQLADGQRLDGLVGDQVALERLHLQPTVGVRDIRPGKLEDPRVADERTGGELRELAIVGRRKVLTDLADLFLDDVEVVEQPLGRRSDRPAGVDGRTEATVGGHEHTFVVAQPGLQRPVHDAPRADNLGPGELHGARFEAFDA